jgi:shikimate dehydrogenase
VSVRGPALVGASTRLAAVLGWPVAHTRSPLMHNAAFAALGVDAVFVALPAAPPDLAAVVRGLAAVGALGASVTVPHKHAVIGLCDHVEPPADRVGAVNCLAFEGGAVVGHNTDAGGFVDGLRADGIDPAGRRAVVLGGGGAARAVATGLVDAGATVIVVARRPQAITWCRAHPWTALAGELERAELLVDATSAALDDAGDRALAEQVPLVSLPDGAAVASLIYHRRPELLRRAADRGLITADGLPMLLYQGARAFSIWTGRPAPIEVMRTALLAG